MEEPYELLIKAIVMQAVTDYRKARKKLKKRPRNEDARIMLEDCEDFFLSPWFETLSNLDGEMILNRLKQEEIQ